MKLRFTINQKILAIFSDRRLALATDGKQFPRAISVYNAIKQIENHDTALPPAREILRTNTQKLLDT